MQPHRSRCPGCQVLPDPAGEPGDRIRPVRAVIGQPDSRQARAAGRRERQAAVGRDLGEAIGAGNGRAPLAVALRRAGLSEGRQSAEQHRRDGS